jgi:colanic acid/amylovoran biosynthesis protein
MEVIKVVVANVFGAVNKGDAALIEVCVDEIYGAFPGASVSGIASSPASSDMV